MACFCRQLGAMEYLGRDGAYLELCYGIHTQEERMTRAG